MDQDSIDEIFEDPVGLNPLGLPLEGQDEAVPERGKHHGPDVLEAHVVPAARRT